MYIINNFFNELIEFVEELSILIMEDWYKFKLFIKDNNTSFIYFIIFAFSILFVDFSSLGSSWNRYSKKNNIYIRQYGGSTATPVKAAEATATPVKAAEATATPVKAAEATTAEAKTAEAKTAEAKTAEATTEAKTAEAKTAEAKTAEAKTAEAKTAEATTAEAKALLDGTKDAAVPKKPDSELKDVDKKLSWFKKMKTKMAGATGSYGALGPVFGNLNEVFDRVGILFSFAASILVFVGVISLPVLIFLVLTYCVIKMMVSKFTGL